MPTITYNDSAKDKLIKQIVRLRKNKNLSVYAVSQDAPINQSTWHRVEVGDINPTIDTLCLMLKTLGARIQIEVH